jgi:uncharacterized protein (TIGR02598 family)
MNGIIASRPRTTESAFSLVEVVLALGVISVAIIAILGVLPVGLQSSHSAQDETRAAHIAQNIISAMASQAPTQFTNVTLPVSSPAPAIDLSSSTTTTASPAAFLYADNDGRISQSPTGATYSISIMTDNFSTTSPAPVDSGYANKITVRVVFPPLATPSSTPTNRTVRDFVRIISKY